MTFYLVLAFIYYIGTTAGLYGIFKKAGLPRPWVAFIPVVNLYYLLRIMGKSMAWFILLALPFFNIITLIILLVDLAKCMGKDSLGWQLFVSFFPFIALPILGFRKDITYLGTYQEASKKLPRKSSLKETVELVVFTLLVAWGLRTFLIEPFNIPTGSMERTLRVGDFLFVSKIHYGTRIPITPLSFPLAHNTLPILDIKSYIEKPSLPYMRLPALETIDVGDIIVFNYPMQDERPVDKRDHYIKRCLATPGDTLQIINTRTYINGKEYPLPATAQVRYLIRTDGTFSYQRALRDLGIRPEDFMPTPDGNVLVLTTTSTAQQFRRMPGVLEVEQVIDSAGRWDPNVFPHDSQYRWNIDNYGPIYMPRRGDTLPLNSLTYPLYKRLIEVYEKAGKLTIEGDQVFLNGRPVTFYVTRMGYYFGMGDNRHNSLDSRFWGFIPEDHMVGKPLMVWFSWEKNPPHKGPRWNRIFRWIRN